MKKFNQKGFGLVEGLLIIIIVLILGFIGWFVWQRQNASKDSASSQSSAQTDKSPADNSSKVSYKTYTSPSEKSSFEYPSNWKSIPESQQTVGPPVDSSSKHDTFVIESPDGKLIVIWASYLTGLGGACDNQKPTSQGGCDTIYYDSVTPTSADSDFVVVEGVNKVTKYRDQTNFKDPNSVLYEPILYIGNKVDKYRELNSPNRGLFYPLFFSPHTVDGDGNKISAMLSISGIGSGNEAPTFATKQAAINFRQTADYKQAKKILMSYHY